jgi:hypothetical protein
VASVDELNLMGDYIDTINKVAGTYINGSEEVCLDIKASKTWYMLVCHDQKAGQILYIKVSVEKSRNSDIHYY